MTIKWEIVLSQLMAGGSHANNTLMGAIIIIMLMTRRKCPTSTSMISWGQQNICFHILMCQDSSHIQVSLNAFNPLLKWFSAMFYLLILWFASNINIDMHTMGFLSIDINILLIDAVFFISNQFGFHSIGI